MDVTTMQSNSLLNRLKKDHPSFHFVESDHFAWQPEISTILWSIDGSAQLLHELGHAILGHDLFNRDIELLGMERDAWEEARKLAKKYDIDLDTTTVEDDLDTYREWLHARSTCPRCNVNGIQVAKDLYQCLICDAKWRVNDARVCNLKRTLLINK